jgi:hypothetical protein
LSQGKSTKAPLHLSPGVRDLKIVDIPCEL